MGQKAKNAGKKNSKTCNKLATTKSIKCSGGRMKLKCIESHFAIHKSSNEIIGELNSTTNISTNYKKINTRNSLKIKFNDCKKKNLIENLGNVEFMDCENIIKELK